MQNSAIRIALEAAIEAGHEILRIYNDPAQDFGIEKKADNSPLTLADKAAHACIVKHLTTMPYPILSEEGKHLPYEDRKAWKELWIVDPLDGTKEFIKKNGEFTVNIAFVRNGTPLFGVIYVPVKGDLYWGINNETPKAYKAQINPQEKTIDVEHIIASATPLPLTNKNANDPYVIVASRSHMSEETQAFVHDKQKEYTEVNLVSSGSSIKICLVAEGVADAYPRYAPTMEWDTAAGDAIARAAGCQMTNAQDGLPLEYNKENLLNPWFLVSSK